MFVSSNGNDVMLNSYAAESTQTRYEFHSVEAEAVQAPATLNSRGLRVFFR
jgi:hypothetical protein